MQKKMVVGCSIRPFRVFIGVKTIVLILNRTIMLKKTLLLTAGLLCLLTACDSDDNNSRAKERKDITLTRSQEELLEANTDFAFRFFGQVRSSEQESPNLFISPLSASLCLSMVANGADRNTLDEMLTTLGFPAERYNMDDLNSYNQTLVNALLSLDNTTRLSIANSIWVNQGFHVLDAFANVNKTMYDARVSELDFSSPKALKTINNWCADETNGCIKEILDELTEETKVVLANALYFKGIWKTPFKESNTKAEFFSDANGSHNQVKMMNLSNTYFNFCWTEDYDIAELPYGNAAFSMAIVLPHEDKTLDECLAQLDGDTWKQRRGEMSSQKLNVKLPRFELSYERELTDDLKALGINDLFNPYTADLSKMAEVALFISMVKQVSYIKVNEEGTEAASVTIAKGDLAAAPPSMDDAYDFYVNRPFAFMIKELSTGAILFMGKVEQL